MIRSLTFFLVDLGYPPSLLLSGRRFGTHNSLSVKLQSVLPIFLWLHSERTQIPFRMLRSSP